VMQGPVIPPQQQLLLYSADQWEDFIQEWVHFCVKGLYVHVQRFTGAGDCGIDIAGFADRQGLQGIWDNYQCKHYDDPLTPTVAWPELGKVLWYSFKGEFRAPRRYYFVAPKGVGTTLRRLLADANKLRDELIENWDRYARNKISKSFEVPLEGAFKKYVESFDFSIFDERNSLQIVEDHRKCPFHAARFGGGLPPRPSSQHPPDQVASHEVVYVAKLLDAYAEHSKAEVSDVASLKSFPKLHEHFGRQRESFYHAESLRVFARDNVPPHTFDSLQNDIYGGVIDVHDSNHPDGYQRVVSVTKAARDMQLTSNALISCMNPKDRDGICHQLANDGRLTWKK
jgi:hypothetical protein